MSSLAVKMPRQALAKILVVEDDLDLREAVQDTLEIAGYEVVGVDSGEAALVELAGETEFHCVISDVNMGGMDGHELLRSIRSLYPQLPVILNTAYGSIDRSVTAMREGAVDYLVKPFAPQVLVDTVARYTSEQLHVDDGEPIANDASSLQLLQLARRVANSDSTALIIGESGTGKEVLARYVHAHSPRADKAFVAINCAAIPENMLEAMLFGHEKGAFTGAYSSAPGKFEQANGGTLLLDEISEMDIGLQAKLLRVLQEKEVERLGGRKTISLDVRVIATSNRDMREFVEAGKFREDLYFRLSVLPLQWAPLRDRPADILPLAEKLLAKHAAKQYRKGVQLDPGAREALLAYLWPGNVRELDNVMQRALILQPGASISAQDLGLMSNSNFSAKPGLLAAASGPISGGTPGGGAIAAGALAGVAVSRTGNVGTGLPADLSQPAANNSQLMAAENSQGAAAVDEAAVLGDDLRQREFEIIISTLRQERGSKKNTAERLGISARTLRYKIARLKELGLDVGDAYAR
ncbi:sigma-54-dependent Fis family transcriptional regulator [Pseudomaricurvus alcaniphilus]|uniref:sigma-54-dependent transcriptional regulator n=1 Tax=Pseudomaricurvus alcaniphilus TaxID=1166482 RepID=UPI001409215D|nr:sigma-54 dependent transcriptional regulator [Pseudomaricurvus alcaniphilus]NHN39430.1 sigma-54-dependent Fis family transcriptional regulator [Pseudomaricurvus alcaniphilus]